jgi:F-type H+-transporting ATPase subunit gamma
VETLESLRRQLRTAQDVEAVVSTMKGLAAVNVRRYQRASDAMVAYVHTIELGLQAVLRQHPELLSPGPAGRGAEPREVLVVFGSDQGLCGPINRHVADRAHVEVAAGPAPAGGRLVVAVGLRLAHELERVGLPATVSIRQPATPEAIASHVRELVVRIDAWRREVATSRVRLVHARPIQRGAMSYEPDAVTLWPLDPRWLADLRARPWATRALPSFRGPWDEVFAHLVRERLFATVYLADAASLAAIEASRLVAMQAAEHNLEERLEDLHERFHRQRQAAITAELLDVIAGAEAAG